MNKRAQPPPKTSRPRAKAGKPPSDDAPQLSQREKFIQAAREAGCDETGEALDEALRAIGRARKR